jgi:hypothetical protein
MSSWKKYFSAVPSPAKTTREVSNSTSGQGGTSGKYSSFLPEVYSGAPNRVERYIQYEQMDLDSEISKALDVISDFSTQNFENDTDPFDIVYHDELTDTEITLLKDTLRQWCSLNKWQQRLWRAFRNVIKYGDQIYIRDPETFELIWVDPTKVEKIIVNENRGKDIEQYVIRDIDLNLQSMVATSMLVHDQYSFPGGYPRSSNPAAGAGTVNYGVASSPGSRNSRFNLPDNNYAIDGTHVVHLSLSEGMDSQWPFGTSILESIYKVYKQKDLLEDSIIIYRIVRAPERRIFYIDVGNLSGPRAMQYVERIKNEIYQRRIPNRTGGGQSILDAAYSPIAINEDFFLAQNSEGKGSRIETLPGGENLGQIDDLKYFNNKMIRGLGIPSSYLPTGPEDGTTVFSDGKIGSAFVQEYRFTKYCQRLQNLVAPVLDREFKLFLKHRGIEISSSLFDLQFWEPQSFSDYRRIQKESEQINLFTSIMGSDANRYISKRYALMRYLGWTEEDVIENERRFQEENADKVKAKTGKAPSDENNVDLASVGIRDVSGFEEPGLPGEPGGEAPPDVAAPASPEAAPAAAPEAPGV